MKKYNFIKIKEIFLSMISFPLFVFMYIVAFYELYTLCRYGRYNNNFNILILCLLFFLVYLIKSIINIRRKPVDVPNEIIENYTIIDNNIKLEDYLSIEVEIKNIKSFNKINIPRKEVTLNSGTIIEPFDFPSMPFEDKGI